MGSIEKIDTSHEMLAMYVIVLLVVIVDSGGKFKY